MSAISYEPRSVMWARAEVCWHDEAGRTCTSAATIEDTSASGACIRMGLPVPVGSQVNVKWHRGEFSAIAQNCRRDGFDFLLGVRREKVSRAVPRPESTPTEAPAVAAPVPAVKAEEPAPPRAHGSTDRGTSSIVVPAAAHTASAILSSDRAPDAPPSPSPARESLWHQTVTNQILLNQERHTMESKGMFPKFWRREQADVTPEKPAAEPASKPAVSEPPVTPRAKGDLLSYEDIYRAAGILRQRSAYDIHKVVEMLHSDRIGGMPEEMRRASVLMAIEAAGASPDDLLHDATERQQALDAYEAAQRRQTEQFETRKALENAQLEAEMARVAAHYAERIKANLDQVNTEKDALRNWEMAKQHESQRISEVIGLCAMPAPESNAIAASGGARSAATPRTTSGPSLVSGVASGRPN